MATILCLGDSHTRGFYGSDWVSMLQGELGTGATLVRAGVDGQLARNIERRSARALAGAGALLCGVVLFCGTNDALACSPDWRLFHERRTGHVLPGEDVSVDSFERDVRRILALVAATRFASAAAAAEGAAAAAPSSSSPPMPVALVTLPPLDEHDFADGPRNAVVRDLNARLAKIAADERGNGVTLVDLFSVLEQEARRSPPPPRRPGAPPPPAHTPGAMVRGGMLALARRWLLRQPWDRVAAAGGGRLLTDRVHLSDRAGRALCGALVPWARRAAPAATAAAALGGGGGGAGLRGGGKGQLLGGSA